MCFFTALFVLNITTSYKPYHAAMTSGAVRKHKDKKDKKTREKKFKKKKKLSVPVHGEVRSM